MISLQKGVYTPSGEVSVYVYSEQYTQYIIYKYIDIEYIYIYVHEHETPLYFLCSRCVSFWTTGIVGGTLSYANRAHCADCLANFSHGTVTLLGLFGKWVKLWKLRDQQLERIWIYKLHTIVFGVKMLISLEYALKDLWSWGHSISSKFQYFSTLKTDFIFYLVVSKVFSLLVPAICDSRHKSGCGGQRPWKWRNVDLLAAVVKKNALQTQAAPNGLEI